MHKITSPLAVASLAAIIALAACSEQEPEVVGGMADPDAGEIEEMAPAELPPMRTHEASYRCSDNSVVYVSYYTNDSQVGVAMDQSSIQTILHNEAIAAAEAAEAAGEEAPEASTGTPRYSGEGFTLIGTAEGSSVQFARGGGGLQRCNA